MILSPTFQISHHHQSPPSITIKNWITYLIIQKHGWALLISMLKAYYTYYTKKKMRKLQRKRLRLVKSSWPHGPYSMAHLMMAQQWWLVWHMRFRFINEKDLKRFVIAFSESVMIWIWSMVHGQWTMEGKLSYDGWKRVKVVPRSIYSA